MADNNSQGDGSNDAKDVNDLLGKAKDSLKKLGGESKKVLQGVVDITKTVANSIRSSKDGFRVMGSDLKKLGSMTSNLASSISKLTLGTVIGKISNLANTALTKLGPIGLAIGGIVKLAGAVGDKLAGGFIKGGKYIKNLSKDSSDFFTSMTGHVTEYIEMIPIFGGLLSGLVKSWASILDLLIGTEDRIIKAGRQIGLSATEATKLNDKFAQIAFNSNESYITSKSLLESQVELNTASGLNVKVSEENLKANIALSKFAGLEAKTREQIYMSSVATGMSMKSIAGSVVGQVSDLKEATGISFNYQSILKEAASQSGILGLMFTKYPGQLAKSLISVKALGFELKSLQTIGDGMLDFEKSISKEFEAQLILGKDINLNKAREAFLNNDLVGAAAEITKYAGNATQFLKLNRIEQQVYADTFEMSIDQMADFLKQQEVLVKTGFATKEQLMAQVKLSRENNQLKDDLIKKIGQEQVENMINQSMQEDLAASVEKIKQSLVDFLTRTELLDKIRSFVKQLTDPDAMRGLVEKIKNVISKFVGFLATVSDVALAGIQGVADFFGKGNIVARMQELRGGIASFTQSLDEGLNKYLTVKEKATSSEEKGSEESAKPRLMKKVGDAIIYPGGRMVEPDRLDYSLFTKNPSSMIPSINEESLQRAITSVVRAISDRPVIIQSSLNLDGQVAAKSNYTNVKNNPLLGFDRTFGQMSLNT